MDWKEEALRYLHQSLHPVKTELNELDWKSGLSEKSERLAQHISAFANQTGQEDRKHCPEQSQYFHSDGAHIR